MSKIESIKPKDDDVIVKFVNSYEFEGETITELDFSGMDDITAKDMIQANNLLTRSGRVVAVPEMDLQYILFIAHLATHKPLEFFDKLKPRDAVKVKNKVTNYFFGDK